MILNSKERKTVTFKPLMNLDDGSKVALWMYKQMASRLGNLQAPPGFPRYAYPLCSLESITYYKASSISSVCFKTLPIIKGTWIYQSHASWDCFFQTGLFFNMAKWKQPRLIK